MGSPGHDPGAKISAIRANRRERGGLSVHRASFKRSGSAPRMHGEASALKTYSPRYREASKGEETPTPNTEQLNYPFRRVLRHDELCAVRLLWNFPRVNARTWCP